MAMTITNTTIRTAPTAASIGLGDLVDVTLTTPLVAGQVLKFGGINWINSTLSFTELSNTPNTFTGQANKILSVKNDESGLEYVAAGTPEAPLDSKLYGRINAAWQEAAAYQHPHTVEDITNIAVVGRTGQYSDLLGIPLTFAPSAHIHPISNITGLQTALDGKQPLDADLTSISNLVGPSGLLRKTAIDTWALDTSVYITGNQTITLSGDTTGTGTTAITTTISSPTVTGKLLTGYAVGTNTAIDATDTILSAFGKAQGQITALSSVAGYLRVDGSNAMVGNLNMTGDGLRFRADVSSATLNNRFAFQPSTLNSGGSFGFMPNGTGSSIAINLYNTSTPDSPTSLLQLSVGTAGTIRTTTTNAGAVLPLNIQTPAASFTLSATENRFQANFSDATHANRFIFQSLTPDATSSVSVAPNGAGAGSNFVAWGNSTVSNPSYFQMGIDAALGLSYIHSGSIGTGSFLPLVFRTSGLERMRVGINGNISMGSTDTSTYNLRVANTQTTGTGTDNAGVLVSSVNRSAYVQLDFAATNSSSLVFSRVGNERGRIIYYDNDSLAFNVNQAERMRIDSAGNVGIGATAPLAKLDVEINGGVSGIRVSNAISNQTPAGIGVIDVQGSRIDANPTFGGRYGASFRRQDGVAIISGQDCGYYTFGGQWGTDTTFQQAKMLYPASVVGVSEGSFTSATAMPMSLSFRTGSTGSVLYGVNQTYGSERMRITSAGNVGIGKSNPTSKLDIVCPVNQGLQISDGTITGLWTPSGIGGMFLGSTSNHQLGLGTNNVVRVAISTTGRIQTIANNEQYNLQLNNGATLNGPWLGSPSSDVLNISQSGGATMMSIAPSGTTIYGALSITGSFTAAQVIGRSTSDVGLSWAAQPLLTWNTGTKAGVGFHAAGASNAASITFNGSASVFEFVDNPGTGYMQLYSGAIRALAPAASTINVGAGTQGGRSIMLHRDAGAIDGILHTNNAGSADRWLIRGDIDGAGNLANTQIDSHLYINGGGITLGGAGGEGGQIEFRNAANSATSAFIDVDAANNVRIYNAANTGMFFYTNATQQLYLSPDGTLYTKNIVASNPLGTDTHIISGTDGSRRISLLRGGAPIDGLAHFNNAGGWDGWILNASVNSSGAIQSTTIGSAGPLYSGGSAPAAEANDTQIATTAWVRSNFVTPTTGAQTAAANTGAFGFTTAFQLIASANINGTGRVMNATGTLRASINAQGTIITRIEIIRLSDSAVVSAKNAAISCLVGFVTCVTVSTSVLTGIEGYSVRFFAQSDQTGNVPESSGEIFAFC